MLSCTCLAMGFYSSSTVPAQLRVRLFVVMGGCETLPNRAVVLWPLSAVFLHGNATAAADRPTVRPRLRPTDEPSFRDEKTPLARARASAAGGNFLRIIRSLSLLPSFLGSFLRPLLSSRGSPKFRKVAHVARFNLLFLVLALPSFLPSLPSPRPIRH